MVEFVVSAAEAANDPVFGKEALTRSEHIASSTFKSEKRTQKLKSSSFATSVQVDSTGYVYQNETKGQCHLCKGTHDLDDCTEFAKKSMEEKRDFYL